MSEKVITLADFSGGLNTAVDESRLEINQSAEMRNVEVLDSKAIRRRAGYSRVTATPMRDDSVFAVTRQYRALGAKSWAARTGTGVFHAEDVAVAVNESVQAETLGTYTTESFTGFSGGSAVLCATPTAFPVPYSTYVRASVYGAASAKVDGGAYQSVSGSYVAFGGLSATSHTITVKPTATRNTSAMRFTVNTTGAAIARPAVTATPTHTFALSDCAGKRVRIRFYDPYTSINKPMIWVGLGIYDAYIYNSTVASVYVAGDTYYTNGGTHLGNRSAGWHELDFTNIQFRAEKPTKLLARVALDGGTSAGLSGDLPYPTASSTRVSLQINVAGNGYSSTVEFDDYRINTTLVDDFANLTSWVTAQTSATASVAVTSARYFSGVIPAYVDVIDYKTSPSYTRFAGLSASSDDLAIATHNNYIYFGSPHTAIRRYNGSTVASVTASGAAPAARFVVNHKRRLFAAGKASDPSLLEYTAVDAPENWTGGGAIRMVGKDSGGECTGLAVWNDILWYFGPSRVNALDCTGTDSNWVNKTVSQRFGCIAPHSLVVAPDALIFLSADGVRGYGNIPGLNDEDGSGFLWLSENIQPTLKRINQDALDKVCAAFYNNRYYLSVPLDAETENSTTFVYRFAEEGVAPSWTQYDYGVTCFCVPRGDENALYGGTLTGNVLKLETGTSDGGAPITLFYRTPPLTSDGYASVKHYRRMYLAAEASADQALTVTPYTDDTAGVPQTLSVTSATGVQPIRTPMNARGRSLGLEFESSGSDQDLTISEVSLTFVQPRMR